MHFTIAPFSSYLIRDPEIIQIRLIFILSSQAGIRQIALFIVPFFQAAIVKHLQIIFNDKWNDIIFQTLLEHNQSSHTPIAISLCQVWDKSFFQFLTLNFQCLYLKLCCFNIFFIFSSLVPGLIQILLFLYTKHLHPKSFNKG